MSVAFTREEDAEASAAHLPDRPVSAHPNLVTMAGLAALESALAEARAAYTAAQAEGGVHADRTRLARATRELRYLQARRASAQLTQPDPARAGVQFGSEVEIVRADGRRQRFRIVGEDEADPPAGLISYVSPLARILLGCGVGQEATLNGQVVEVLAIRHDRLGAG